MLATMGDDIVGKQRFKAARTDRMASTVNKILARLKTMLRSAVEWGLIAAVPPIIAQLRKLSPYWGENGPAANPAETFAPTYA